MAIEEYLVVCNQRSLGGRNIERSWNGAHAEEGGKNPNIKDINIRDARAIVVEATSVAEAIRGVKQLYPGDITTKCQAVLKESLTEE